VTLNCLLLIALLPSQNLRYCYCCTFGDDAVDVIAVLFVVLVLLLLGEHPYHYYYDVDY